MNREKARILDHFVPPNASALRDRRYLALRSRLEAAGLFRAARWSYGWRIALIVSVFSTAFALLLRAPAWPLRVAAWIAIAFVLVQGSFLSHDAMHGSVTPRRRGIALIGHFFDTFLVGFSFSYFRRSHGLHHSHCNEESADPDTQSSLFSVFEASAKSKRGLGRLMTRYQQILLPLFYPTWALVMKWDALTYLARNRKKSRVDLLILPLHLALWFGAAHWIGFGAALLNYVGWSAFAGLYLGAIIPMNHVGMPTVTGGAASFLELQTASTRNVSSSWLRDFFFIGVNNHIEHHLFPSVPSMRLGAARPIVREFCREENLPYCEEPYFAANARVLVHFERMARAARPPRAPSTVQPAAPLWPAESSASTRPKS